MEREELKGEGQKGKRQRGKGEGRKETRLPN